MNMPRFNETTGLVNKSLLHFINQSVLPQMAMDEPTFWQNLNQLLNDFSPLTAKRLNTIEGQANEPSELSTANVDPEIAAIKGPQMVAPVNNARFALNAANARWGSLYDVLYGTNVIAQSEGLKVCKKYNQARGNHVIGYAKAFLDEVFPLASGSHEDVTSYLVYYQHLLAMFPDGSTQGLRNPCQFVALSGHKSEPTDLVLKNNGLHVVIEIDRNGANGCKDLAGIEDIQIEAAQTTIMDFEDSDTDTYRHWLGLMQADLEVNFDRKGQSITRQLDKDKRFTCKDGDDFRLSGRTVMMARTVGDVTSSDLKQRIVDTVLTTLIGMVDLQNSRPRNSRAGNIYIVKPQMDGPEAVTLSAKLFDAVEDMLLLRRNTLKLVVVDDESPDFKTTIGLAKERIVLMNGDGTCPQRAASPSAAVLQTLADHKATPFTDQTDAPFTPALAQNSTRQQLAL